MKNLILTTFYCVALNGKADSASTTVNLNNTVGTELRDLNGNLLTGGTDASNDGALLQFGYYTLATTVNPFAGSWVPLTGEGSGNPFYSTVGDKGVPNGRFDYSPFFFGPNPNLPLTALPMAIRFYDSTSISSSTYFNAVSNTSGLWNWVMPAEPGSRLNISLSDSGLIWLDGTGSEFRTTIPIPEPSSAAFIVLATGLLVARRR